MTKKAGPRQICFMVMPFGTKPTKARKGPRQVDFDHLWREALKPAIEGLGYHAVRADQDWGPVIVKEMLERLVASHLVIADITIPNANVYYEIGVRHAAKDVGCVLIAADWARPVFDIQQMTRIAYPLPSEKVDEAEAVAIKTALARAVPKAAPQLSPIKSLIPSYPHVAHEALDAFRQDLEELYDLQTEMQRVRGLSGESRAQGLTVLVEQVLGEPQPSPSAALQVLLLLRDCEQWGRVVEFVDRLPSSLRDLEVVQEQTALAVSNAGDHGLAEARLKSLIARFGPTPERWGILGGRYKRLYKSTNKRRCLEQAIDTYEQGFRLDLNAYYCGCNLPRLLRERGDEGDEDRASVVGSLVAEACRTAHDSGTADDWLNLTWLGVAFDQGDVPLAEACLTRIRREEHPAWRLKSTLDDLHWSVDQVLDGNIHDALLGLCRKLRDLCDETQA